MFSKKICAVACVAVWLVGCSGTSMRRSFKETVHDDVIKTALLYKFTKDKNVKQRHLGVDVYRGVVTLHGRAETVAERNMAEQIAQETRNVVAVENYLVVKSPHDPRFVVEGKPNLAPLRAPVARTTAPRAIPAPTTPVAPAVHAKTAPATAARQDFGDDQIDDLSVGDPLEPHPAVRHTPPSAPVAAKPAAPKAPAIYNAPTAPKITQAPAIGARGTSAPKYFDKGVLPPAQDISEKVAPPKTAPSNLAKPGVAKPVVTVPSVSKNVSKTKIPAVQPSVMTPPDDSELPKAPAVANAKVPTKTAAPHWIRGNSHSAIEVKDLLDDGASAKRTSVDSHDSEAQRAHHTADELKNLKSLPND